MNPPEKSPIPKDKADKKPKIREYALSMGNLGEIFSSLISYD